MKSKLTLLLVLASIIAYSQDYLSFSGGKIAIYNSPVYTGSGYDVLYNIEDLLYDGKIELELDKKIFSIKFTNGDELVCNYVSKKVTRNKKDEILGITDETELLGTWQNNGKPCKLVIQTINLEGTCKTSLYSEKVIDNQLKINVWKKKVEFFTNGDCLINNDICIH